MVGMDIKMAWRNIWRNPRRTLLTITAIAFACVLLIFMLSFQFGSYETMINASVKIHTGHLQIQGRGYHADQEIRQVIADPQPVQQALAAIAEVQAHAPRARAFVLVSSRERTYGVMAEGVDPAAEARVSTLRSIVRQGDYLDRRPSENGLPGALVGHLLARNLKVSIGDELTILGQGRDGSIAATVLRVQGITSSGMDEFDRNALQMPLDAFQDAFAMDGAVHEIVVVGRRLADAPAIRAAMETALARMDSPQPLDVLDWERLMPGLKQAISMDLVSGAIFYLVLIMVVAFSILNTFLMAILERTYEFGVMMAIGTQPGPADPAGAGRIGRHDPGGRHRRHAGRMPGHLVFHDSRHPPGRSGGNIPPVRHPRHAIPPADADFDHGGPPGRPDHHPAGRALSGAENKAPAAGGGHAGTLTDS
jgi:putative ABC transport system permease protein